MNKKELEIQRALGLVRDYKALVSSLKRSASKTHVELVHDCKSHTEAYNIIQQYYEEKKIGKVLIMGMVKHTPGTELSDMFDWYEHKDGGLIQIVKSKV